MIDVFRPGIRYPVLVIELRVDGHIHIFIDSKRDYRAGTALVECRQVGATTNQRDAQGGADNDHTFIPTKILGGVGII